MDVLTKNIKWLMLVSGALTCTMVYATIAPDAALVSTFGQTLDGPVAAVVVRNWGALIALVGGMLIISRHNPLSPSAAIVRWDMDSTLGLQHAWLLTAGTPLPIETSLSRRPAAAWETAEVPLSTHLSSP